MDGLHPNFIMPCVVICSQLSPKSACWEGQRCNSARLGMHRTYPGSCWQCSHSSWSLLIQKPVTTQGVFTLWKEALQVERPRKAVGEGGEAARGRFHSPSVCFCSSPSPSSGQTQTLPRILASLHQLCERCHGFVLHSQMSGGGETAEVNGIKKDPGSCQAGGAPKEMKPV